MQECGRCKCFSPKDCAMNMIVCGVSVFLVCIHDMSEHHGRCFVEIGDWIR
jgi:hypothetical protein